MNCPVCGRPFRRRASIKVYDKHVARCRDKRNDLRFDIDHYTREASRAITRKERNAALAIVERKRKMLARVDRVLYDKPGSLARNENALGKLEARALD